MKVNDSVILMTALVPTTGHLDLIKFASYITEKVVTVIINGRSFEPTNTWERHESLSLAVDRAELHNVVIDYVIDDNAPQNPDPTLEYDAKFWDYWADTIKDSHDVNLDTAIIASEEYGGVLAKHMGCRFIPYDIKRVINPVKGTNVRQSPILLWDNILPEFRKYLTSNFVLFGQESVGKTTLAKILSCSPERRFIPEYARGYLESEHIGAEVTTDKMYDIAAGQAAIQQMTISDGAYPINIFDTDLLSTIGYWEIFKSKMTEFKYGHDHVLVEDFNKMKDSMFYFLLPDDIPLEKDPLRYGGDKRESTYDFWKNLLDINGCKYLEVPRGLSYGGKIDFIDENISEIVTKKLHNIIQFERE